MAVSESRGGGGKRERERERLKLVTWKERAYGLGFLLVCRSIWQKTSSLMLGLSMPG